MQAKFFASDDQDRFEASRGWDVALYGLSPKWFWFSKSELPLSDFCHIVRWDFRGPVRIHAVMTSNDLQIRFIDHYSPASSRLQGRANVDSGILISSRKRAWDSLTDIGASCLDVNFEGPCAEKLLSDERRERIDRITGAEHSLFAPLTAAGQRLRSFLKRYLDGFDQRSELNGVSQFESCVGPLSFPLDSAFSKSAALRERALLGLSAHVIDEAIDHANTVPDRYPEIGSQKRREIALRLEAMLWMPRHSPDHLISTSLEELAEIFDVTPRTIQISVQEQFGISFVAFRKLVRLTQIRREIYQNPDQVSLKALVADYGLHFGRMAKEYKAVFGRLPSQELHRLRTMQPKFSV